MQQWVLSKNRQYYLFRNGSQKIEIADMASCDYPDYPFLKPEKFFRVLIDCTGYDIPKEAIPAQIEKLEEMVQSQITVLPAHMDALTFFLNDSKKLVAREGYYAGNCTNPLWSFSQAPWELVAREYSRLSITSVFLSKSDMFNELNILRNTASGRERYGIVVTRGDFTSVQDIYAVPRDQVPLRKFWQYMTDNDIFIRCGMTQPMQCIENGPLQAQLDELMMTSLSRSKKFQICSSYKEFMHQLGYG